MTTLSAPTTDTTPGAGAAGAAGGAMGQPVVAIQGVSKVFKDFWLRDRARAVENLSLRIEPHEVFGLLGPNGSGKSTTIKMILGLLRPTRGRITVFGKLPTDVGVKRRIGYLPEESYLYPFLNARETLEYYAKLFELDHRVMKRRIDELLDMVGLSHAQHRPVKDYSKGMQRRIGLAQALINDPDFLILDEPTTGLDPIGTRQVKDLIIELGRRGKTVLLSSHLLADVEDCVDRMVILYGGKIRGQGTVDELLATDHRTSIETDELDEATLAEIDALIRARTNGEKGVRRVARPRQKLEELFLGIVEQARRERLETSGALDGGPTAEFLRSDAEEDQPASAEDLLARLSSDEPAPAAETAEVEGAEAPARPDAEQDAEDVLESLAAEPEPEPEPEARPEPELRRGSERGATPEREPAPAVRTECPAAAEDRRPAPAPAEDVDEDLLGSLLDRPGDDGDAEGERR